ncbi:TPA: YggU family protein [Legionella pneumophila]|nr:YggU family protein [Legionella pneumophila]
MEQQNHLPIPAWCKQKNNALILSLYIQPGAKCNQVIGVVGEELKVKIAAPSIEDKANVELVRYLAVLFKVPKSQIKIQRGLKSRHKIIEVLGCGVDVQWLIDL